MSSVVNILTIVVFVIATVCDSVKAANYKPKSSSDSLRTSLRNLRNILKRMDDFVWNLRELKYVLHDIKKSKMHYDKDRYSLEEKCNIQTCENLYAKKLSSQITNNNSTNMNSTTKKSTEKTTQKSTEKTTKKQTDRVVKKRKEYAAYEKSLVASLYKGYDTLERRMEFLSCEKLSTKKIEIKYDGKVKLPATEGTMIKNCGKKHYFLGYKKMILSAVVTYCCNYGMVAATVDNKEDLDCIVDNFKSIKYFKDKKQKYDLFGTFYGDVMLKDEWFGMKSGQTMPSDLWVQGQPDNTGGIEAHACLRLSRDDPSQIGYEDCGTFGDVYCFCEFLVDG